MKPAATAANATPVLRTISSRALCFLQGVSRYRQITLDPPPLRERPFRLAAQTPSWRRQGSAPPAVKKSPLKMAISQFEACAQRTALLRIIRFSPSSQKSFLRKYFCEVSLFFHFVISGEADPSDGLSPATSPNKVRGGKKSAPPFATISDTSKIAILRSMPLFAADAAWVEMVNAGEL